FFFSNRREYTSVSRDWSSDVCSSDLKHHVVFADMDEFYYLARAILVKDERHFDKFDRAFGAYFQGLEDLDRHIEALIPDEWLRKDRKSVVKGKMICLHTIFAYYHRSI